MDCKKFVFSLAVLLAADHVAALSREKIIGGKLVSTSDAPYSASIQVYDQHICTGAFINSSIVLTAAHCIYGEGDTPRIYDYKVVAGRTNLADKNSGKEAYVKTIYVHDSFRAIKNPQLEVENDIALLVLPEDLWDDHLELPEENESFIGKDASIAGWGKNNKNRDPDGQLRSLDVEVVDPKSVRTCELPATPAICVRGKNVRSKVQGTCQGDSGGVVQCDNKAVGIVSYGSCNEAQTPTIYTEVSGFVRFIKGILEGNPIDAKKIDLSKNKQGNRRRARRLDVNAFLERMRKHYFKFS